jgi:Cd(II)/Pb(II)-responsive transcriptional regulator
MKFKIGELAQQTGCQVVTIRYYEKEGLLHQPERTEANYRLYDEKDRERLLFILRCRQHGMTLLEIKNLLAYKDSPTPSCRWVNELVSRHIRNVQEQIDSLEHLKQHLQALLNTCRGDNESVCGIISSLDSDHPCSCCGRFFSSRNPDTAKPPLKTSRRK